VTISVHYVETEHVSQVWPKVASFLEDALTSSPEFPDWYPNYNIHHLQMFLTNGAWLLIVAVEDGEICGACTVSFVNYPLHRIAFVTAIGGKLIISRNSVNQLKHILKQRGATKIQGYGRESIVRLWQRYGFEPRLTLVETQI
jgi:hypothetical protein